MTDENSYKDYVLGKSAKHGFTIIASKHSLKLIKGDKSSHFCSWDEIASFFEGYEYNSFNEGIKAIAIALKCPTCKGEGDIPDRIMDKTKTPPREVTVFPPCGKCGGSGEISVTSMAEKRRLEHYARERKA